MVLTTALHVHEPQVVVSCSECAHQVTHVAHINAQPKATDDCVLCQFANTAYITPPIVALLPLFLCVRSRVLTITAKPIALSHRVWNSRAPPYYLN